MKIIHIIPTLSYGGAEKICMDLCNEQAKNNEVLLYTMHEYNNKWRPLSQLGGVRYLSGNFMKERLLSFVKVFRMLLKEKPQVVHTHLGTLLYVFLFCIYNLFSRKATVVYTFHTEAKNDAIKRHRIILGILFKYFNVRAVAISTDVKKTIEEAYDLKRVALVNNGILVPAITEQYEAVKSRIELLKPTANSKVLLNLARISKIKNQQLLVEAFNELVLTDKEDIILLILGEVQDTALKTQLESIKSDNVYLLPAVNNVSDYLAIADFFCLSSSYEGQPISLLEAMAFNRIAICTPVGGMKEMIESGYSGILSADCTVKGYYNALQSALRLNVTEAELMRKAAFNHYNKNYKIEVCNERYLELYKKK